MDKKIRNLLIAVVVVLIILVLAAGAYTYVGTKKLPLTALSSAAGPTTGTCTLDLTVTGTPASTWVGKKIKIMSTGVSAVNGVKTTIASISGSSITTAPVTLATCPTGTPSAGDMVRVYMW